VRKLVALLFAVACLAGLPRCFAQTAPVKNILVLHEGWEKFPVNALVNAEIQDVLSADDTFEEQVFQEYMDDWRLEVTAEKRAEALRRKYWATKLDLIIAVGSTPFQLLLSQGAKFFPGVPVLFMMVPAREIPRGVLPRNVTGVTIDPDFAGTVELALRLQPDTRNVVVVSGKADLDHFYANLARQDVSRFAGRLTITYLTGLTPAALLSRLSQLPEHTVVLYVTLFQDGAGHSYVPSQACSMISASANAPVYGFFQTYMGRGILGGSIVNVKKNAKQTAELALQVLKGAGVQNLPVRAGPPNELVVDWRQLQRWHIPESRLPKGTALLFAAPSLWQSYRWYILGAIVILLLQALLIATLLVEARRRAAAERAVKRSLEFETLISETSARFINLPPDQIETEIERGLDRVRSFLNVDRLSLYDRPDPGMEFRALHLAAQENTTLMFPFLTEKQFPWAISQLKSGKAVLVEGEDQLPKEALAERVVATKGIKSFAVIPLEAGGAVLGLLVLATMTKRRGWPQELVRQLQILGDIFYQAVLRKRAEEASRESEQRFVLVADSAPMLVWMSGADQLCTYFNKGWLDFTGRSLEQELGNGWTAGVHPEDLDRCLNIYAQAFEARRDFKMEYRLRRHDGEYRWVMDCGVPRYSPDKSFCGYIGTCIDVTDLKRSQQEMEELSGRLIHAQEEERRRVARELHDNFGQKLVVLSMELAQHLSKPENPPQIEACLRDLSEKLKEVSRAMNVTAHQLHSSHLEVLGLVSAIQGLCHEFTRQYGIEAAFSHTAVPSRVPADIALCLFRVVQEGLQNVAKHSCARTCSVELMGTREGIHLRVSDSGIGFDTARLKLKPGLGFISMRERLRLVGGEITVDSKPSEGTLLDVHVPLASMTTAA
jgi:PAS domain S-box-containing protein